MVHFKKSSKRSLVQTPLQKLFYNESNQITFLLQKNDSIHETFILDRLQLYWFHNDLEACQWHPGLIYREVRRWMYTFLYLDNCFKYQTKKKKCWLNHEKFKILTKITEQHSTLCRLKWLNNPVTTYECKGSILSYVDREIQINVRFGKLTK